MAIAKNYHPHKIPFYPSSLISPVQVALPVDNFAPLDFEHLYELFVKEALAKMSTLAQGKKIAFKYYSSFSARKEILSPYVKKDPILQLKRFRRQVAQGKKNQKKNQHLLSQFLGENLQEQDYFSFLTEATTRDFLNSLLSKGTLRPSKELLYRDVTTQTFVNGDDIVRKEVNSTQLEIKCFVETKNETFSLIIEDPFSLFGDLGVLVHPKDKRYKKHLWKRIIIPLINHSIPILEDETIDTVTNNWIVRLNPLLSPEHLQQVIDRQLPLQELEYWDEFGYFSDSVPTLSGRSIFEFKANLINALETIGNLVDKKEIKLIKPFSKYSNQELLPKVSDVWVMDFCPQKEAFLLWLAEQFPKIDPTLFLDERQVFPIENYSNFSPKLFLTKNSLGDFEFLPRSFFWDTTKPNMLSALLILTIITKVLPSPFKIEDLIDTFFLLESEGIRQLLLPFFSPESIKDFFLDYSQGAWEEQYSKFSEALQSFSRIVYDAETGFYSADLAAIGAEAIQVVALDPGFLSALWLFLKANDEQLVLYWAEDKNFFSYQLMFSFLKKQEISLSFLPSSISKSPTLSKIKYSQLMEKYGSDALRLYFFKQESFNLPLWDQEYAYLKHFWNLYKYLFDHYPIKNYQVPSSLFNVTLSGIDVWILDLWYKLISNLPIQGKESALSIFLEKVQHFSKTYFSRYLAFIKQKKQETSSPIVVFLFIQMLYVLSPYIPKLTNYLLHQFPHSLIEELRFYSELPFQNLEKDYKVYLFFDILASLLKYKDEQKIPKHQPISLFLKANTDVCDLVQQHQAVLWELCPIAQFIPAALNENIPDSYAVIRLFDIEIGIRVEKIGKESPLELLEKEYQHKERMLSELRSTLAAFSMSGLVDSEKLASKEKEMEDLKDELMHLDISIKKLKMERKK